MFQNASVPLMQDAQGFLQIAIADSHKHSEIRVPLDHAEKRARTDVLTEPPNRLAFEDFFCNAQMAAVENGRPLSVLLIDVDHFKRFNDNFGHGVGDQVFRLIAKVLRERVRDQDLSRALWRRGAYCDLSRLGFENLRGSRRIYSQIDF
jgi:PleD family two-component response regulator